MRYKDPPLEPRSNYSTKPFKKRLKYLARRYLIKNQSVSYGKSRKRLRKRKNPNEITMSDIYAELAIWLGIWGLLTLVIWIIIVILEPLIGGWIFESIFTNIRINRSFLGEGIFIPLIAAFTFLMTYFLWTRTDSRLRTK
ncbi:MAG: hypothetical protein ACW981_13325 [Candidatus Hodarchaeales archaeon]|jgi:hypothetical protein